MFMAIFLNQSNYGELASSLLRRQARTCLTLQISLQR
jgi:hypothetical protein